MRSPQRVLSTPYSGEPSRRGNGNTALAVRPDVSSSSKQPISARERRPGLPLAAMILSLSASLPLKAATASLFSLWAFSSSSPLLLPFSKRVNHHHHHNHQPFPIYLSFNYTILHCLFSTPLTSSI